jgi:quinohemoprotein amine dehydrogenase
VREAQTAEILTLFPQALRAGVTTPVIIIGNGLASPANAPASFGEGTSVTVVHQEANRLRLLVKVAANAAPGVRQVSAGGAAGRIAVYAQIDQIDVKPAYAIARLGGGRVEPVSAQFEAIASTRLADGTLLSLGPVPAEWSSIPFDADAKRTEDEKYAGHFDARGRFLPSAAGPNPAREFSGDNVGNLTVVARAADGNRSIDGRGHLVVTVQRWITPPIY